MAIDIPKTVDKARSKGVLHLPLSDKLPYFGYGLMFLLVAVIFLWEYVLDFIHTGGFFYPSATEIIGIVAVIIFIVYVAFRRGIFRFKIIGTILPKDELLSLFREVCDAYGMTPLVLNRDMIVIEYVPGGWSRGQRMTIVFDSGRVLFNSVTRPQDVFDRMKNVSIGENTLNFDIFREEIRDREREYKGLGDSRQ